MESVAGDVEQNRIPKSSTQRSREYRKRKRSLMGLDRKENRLTGTAKTGAERMREYRLRQKCNQVKTSKSEKCFQSAVTQHCPVQPVEFSHMERNVMQSVCRLCLGEDSKFIYVYESRRFEGWTAADGITEFLQMQVSQDDEYPQSVCINCMEKLEDFKVFKERCESSKQLLDRAYAGKRGSAGRKEAAEGVSDAGRDDINLNDDCLSTALEKDPLEVSEEDIKLSYAPFVPEKTSVVIKSEHVPYIAVKTEDFDDDKETDGNNIQSGESGSEELIPARRVQSQGISNNSDVVWHIKEEIVDIPVESIDNELQEEEKQVLSEHPDCRVPADKLTSVRDEEFVGLCDEIPGAGLRRSKSKESSGFVRKRKKRVDKRRGHPSESRSENIGRDDVPGTFTKKSAASSRNKVTTPRDPVSSNTDLTKYRCNVCSEKFTELEEVVGHMGDHVSRDAFLCEHCKTVFELKQSYKEHDCTAVPVTSRKTYVCAWCEHESLRLSDHVQHLTLHSGDGPFECKLCSKLYTLPASLNRHMYVHFGGKKFKCYICSKVFSRKNNLVIHMRVHTGYKPYGCLECDRNFTQMGAMKQHMKTHSRD